MPAPDTPYCGEPLLGHRPHAPASTCPRPDLGRRDSCRAGGRSTGHCGQRRCREPCDGPLWPASGRGWRQHSHPLQCRRTGYGRLWHRARRHPLCHRTGQKGTRLGRRDPASPSGRAADRVGIDARSHTLHAHRRQRCRAAHAHREGGPRALWRRPGGRQWRRRQQGRLL